MHIPRHQQRGQWETPKMNYENFSTTPFTNSA